MNNTVSFSGAAAKEAGNTQTCGEITAEEGAALEKEKKKPVKAPRWRRVYPH